MPNDLQSLIASLPRPIPGRYADQIAAYREGYETARADVLALLRAQPAATPAAAQPLELMGVAEALAEGDGTWRTCSGCHESNEGYPTGPFSKALQCTLGNGCSECGGIGAIWDTTDYQEMADDMARSTQAPSAARRACNNDECRWIGTTDRMCGSVGPLCPDCGETTEPIAAQQDAADAARWRWATSNEHASVILHSIVLCHGGYQQKINERADVYREADAQRAKGDSSHG